jgi:hypothetical protein
LLTVGVRKVGSVTIAATLLAILMPSSEAGDTNSEIVTLRATGPQVNDLSISYIARNAKPVALDASTARALERQTPRQVITKLCGSLREAYYSAFLAANSLQSLPRDEPLGIQAASLVWPACLYVEVFPGGLKTPVKANESPSLIYSRLTGGGGSQAVLSRFFDASASTLKVVQPNQVLLAAHATAPVSFSPISGDAASFIDGLAKTINASAETLPISVVRQIAPLQGQIVTGYPEDSGLVASSNKKCKVRSDPPFDVAMVATAYQFELEKRKTMQAPPPIGQAYVAVVDNGFYGADPVTNPSEPFANSPFSKAFFEYNAHSVVAQKIEFSEDVWPINFSNDVPATTTSGHGTHVTGVVLGGPPFVGFRTKWLAEKNDPWLQISELNVAKGSDQLIRGTQNYLQSVLNLADKRWIVNLSIAYDGATSPDIRAAYERLFRAGVNSLFVVAAGNEHKNVSNYLVYPAAFGGGSSDNVVTVAALDGDGTIAPFSNHGEAAVDIAAPGCEILSWIDNVSEPVRISGTSQAAPFVTFTAALLRSINMNLTAQDIKERIIASADLLENESDRALLAYKVKLNIPKALLWSDDYLKNTENGEEVFLGEIKGMSGLRCSGFKEEERALADFVSLKRSRDGTAYIFTGRSVNKVFAQPCSLATDLSGGLIFTVKHQIKDGHIEPIEREIQIDWSKVGELIRKSRG